MIRILSWTRYLEFFFTHKIASQMDIQTQPPPIITHSYPVNDLMPSLPDGGTRKILIKELNSLASKITESNAILDVKASPLADRQPAKPLKPPPFISMAHNFAKAANKWVNSNFLKTDDASLEMRLEACRKCEFWNAKGFGGTGRCMKCGCSTWAKLRMATEKCPIGKW